MPLRPKTSEMVKEQERKVELLGVEPRAFGFPCQCSATELQLPPATTLHSFPYVTCSSELRNGMIQKSLIRPGLISLQTKLIGVPTIGLSCDPAQILPDHTATNTKYTVCPTDIPHHNTMSYNDMCEAVTCNDNMKWQPTLDGVSEAIFWWCAHCSTNDAANLLVLPYQTIDLRTNIVQSCELLQIESLLTAFII